MKRAGKFTVAIYSGNIPSTTFIENLIEGMAEAGFNILLFGKRSQKVSYKGNVKVLATPQKDHLLLIFVIRNALKFYFKDRKKFAALYKSLRSRHSSARYFLRDLGAILPILNSSPDIFHIQWAKTLQVYPELMELFGGKIALSLRGAHINYSPLNDAELAGAYRKYFPKVNAFHAVSEAIAAESQKYGAEKSKIHIIHSSVRDSLLSESIKGIKKADRLEVISIGRFHWKKGYHYGLDAMKMLKERNVDFHYTIVAQGETPEEIIFLLNEYGLNDQVSVIPGLKYEDLMKRLKASHVLLLPSVEEGIANVVLEAMAVGIPVVSADCGGMREVVCDDVNGFLVNVRDPEAIADKLTELSKMSEDDILRLTEKARETILKGFTRADQIEQFQRFYNKIVTE